MSYIHILIRTLLFSSAILISAKSWAVSQLDVTLFGQPCLLQGPIDKTKLQAIHAVSPEQALPAFENRLASEPTRLAYLRVKKVSGLPGTLDLYKEKLIRRFEGQVAFLEALEASRSTKSLTPILATARKLIGTEKRADVETRIKKLDPHRLFSNDLIEPVFQAFSDAIEPDPEDLFHRSIKKLGVQYVCSFEAEGDSEESEVEDQPRPAPQPSKPLKLPSKEKG